MYHTLRAHERFNLLPVAVETVRAKNVTVCGNSRANTHTHTHTEDEQQGEYGAHDWDIASSNFMMKRRARRSKRKRRQGDKDKGFFLPSMSEWWRFARRNVQCQRFHELPMLIVRPRLSPFRYSVRFPRSHTCSTSTPVVLRRTPCPRITLLTRVTSTVAAHHFAFSSP